VSVVLAVLAALCNAASNVLERSAARETAPELSMRLSLFRELARRPRWVGGLSLLLVTFALQAAALGFGGVSLVQPLIVLELPLTVAASALFLGTPLQARDALALGGIVAGVVGLLVGLHPAPAAHPPSTSALLLVTGAGGAVVATLVVLALRLDGDHRAALLGAAGGVTVGLTAVFMKRMTTSLADDGLPGVLSGWWTYAMVAAGLFGLYLAQNAYQAGSLVASQPGLTIADPTTGLLVGIPALGEPVAQGGWHLVLAVAGGLAMAGSVVLLARAPALAQTRPEPAA
jgi:drug/metabolite transporter (DMT)-like permease